MRDNLRKSLRRSSVAHATETANPTGTLRGGGTHYIALEARLYTALVELAEQEQRPAEEVQADMSVTALAQRETHGELYHPWSLEGTSTKFGSAMHW